jgi:prepilin-type N-terminal cleavage/methylation domain-containing protein/prepilin-type processing-associated H-X9-DG protein
MSALGGRLIVTNTKSTTIPCGFNLIELLAVIAIIGLLTALILAAVQSAREASRRVLCVNNLKQLEMGAMNYESCHGVLPPGALAAPFEGQPGLTWGMSTLVRILPFFEASSLYNSANFSLQAITTANATVASNGLSVFWCPSDPFVAESNIVDFDYGAPAGTGFRQRHTSYGGCQGMWSIEILPTNAAYTEQLANMNGVIFSCSSVRLADITDGTGTTMLFAETAYGKIPKPSERLSSRWWNSGYVAHSMVTSYYPLNGNFKGVPYLSSTYERWIMTAGSFHPGGANVGFCDGSVRFIKDTVESVAFDVTTGDVPAFRLDPGTKTYAILPGIRLGVWQKLSTRNFGEVLSANSF